MKILIRIIALALAGIAIFHFLGANSDTTELIGALPEKDRAIVAATMNQVQTQFILKGVIASIGAFAAWSFSNKFK